MRENSARLERPPEVKDLLKGLPGKPSAVVLAGHNGSGKSTLWYMRLAPTLQIPLINADRLTLSILPEPEKETGVIPGWARLLRDSDPRWQKMSQDAVKAMQSLITANRMSFAIETVFSHWRPRPDGTFESKVENITALQSAGYHVVLIFVGLVSAQLSMARVATRVSRGGHDVPQRKLTERFPRTQLAIRAGADVADVCLMFNNSLGLDQAFALARVQKKGQVLFDCRDSRWDVPEQIRSMASLWLARTSPIAP